MTENFWHHPVNFRHPPAGGWQVLQGGGTINPQTYKHRADI